MPRPRKLVAPVKAPDGPVVKTLQWASPTQRAAFCAGPDPCLLAGDFGSAKTTTMCLKLLWAADTFPKSRWVIARRVQKELRLTTMATWFKWCPPAAYAEGRRNDQDGVLQLNNGSEILWLYLDNPDTLTVIRGLEMNGFGIDQAEETPERMEEIYDLLVARCDRWDQAEVPAWLLAQQGGRQAWPYRNPETGAPHPPPFKLLTCNRDLKTHWLYRRFHPESIEHQATYRARGYQLFDMGAQENKFLTETNKAALRHQHSGFIGTRPWGAPEGTLHTVDPASRIPGTPGVLEYIRSHCTLHRFLNHGDAQPTVCLWAGVDAKHNCFVYREYAAPGGTISTHRAAITRLSQHERYEFQLASPRLFTKDPERQGGRFSIADEYSNISEHDPRTALHWQIADDNEFATRNRINEYLRPDPDHRHPFTDEPGSPHLYFVTKTDDYPHGCVQVIQELESQRREKIGTNLGQPIFSDKRLKVPEDAYACLRFLMASRAPHALLAAKRPSVRTFTGYRQQLLQTRKAQAALAAVR